MQNIQSKMNNQASKSASITIDNEDDSYKVFTKLLVKAGVLGDAIPHLRCKKAPTMATLSNKFKKVALDFQPLQGQYAFDYNDTTFSVELIRGNPLLVTQCRQLQYQKQIKVYGPTIEKVEEFVKYIFHLIEQKDDQNNITIYENQGGYWRISKEKRPRKLESVIFKQQFIDSVLQDVQDFIDSQDWYTEMGIPYKRSYLLYGPPGTGKSSFAQAFAAHLKFSICFVNCSDKINDFNFNQLLNSAPKKSVILIEDVDAIFSERKNTEKNNQLTFSGFLNSIDGVRSQQGRIIVMTTNYKQRLDPALLRPGRVDQMYEISFASHYQIQKMVLRFFKKEQLAIEFAKKLPEYKFSMSMIQGFLLKFRKCPQKILEKVEQLLTNDENVKIDQFLTEIGCQECINDFKIEQCYTLASAKNLPKDIIQKIAAKLNPLLKGRLIQVVRLDRKSYIKSFESISQFIDESITDQGLNRKIHQYVKQNNVKTFYVVRDITKQFTEEQKKQVQQRANNSLKTEVKVQSQ